MATRYAQAPPTVQEVIWTLGIISCALAKYKPAKGIFYGDRPEFSS
ncbi:hypothetical protein M8C21_024382, partial [Ambrosia artemisiifolia]